MMKLTLCTILATLTFGAFAQNLDFTIERQIERLGRAQQRGAISQLSYGEKEEVSSLLQRALRTVRDEDGRPGPGAGLVPDRRNGRHGPRSGQMIVALIEEQVVLIRGHSPGDLLVNCAQAVRGINNVDDIFFTVNGGPYITRRNDPGYWRTSDEICMQMMNVLDNSYAEAAYIEVSGTIEHRPVSLEGSRGEILETCAELIPAQTSVDDMHLSINRGQVTTAHKQTGYWTGAAQICGQMGRMIDAQVR